MTAPRRVAIVCHARASGKARGKCSTKRRALATTRALADTLFHMVNEALNNIRKHSGARRVWITMSVEASLFRLVVRDDGGSQLGQPAPPFEPTSLCERAKELGGSLHISRPDGLNVELVIQIPLS